ncbi:MAG: YciI family protein [Candidatus Binataceae bacterium]
MSEFAFLFRGRDTSASPEQMQQYAQNWLAWFKQLGEKGHIKETGHPLEHTGKVVKGKQKSVLDGPYAEAKDIVNGYVLIEAKDLAHAVEIAKGCPIFDVGGFVEVRPVRVMNM